MTPTSPRRPALRKVPGTFQDRVSNSLPQCLHMVNSSKRSRRPLSLTNPSFFWHWGQVSSILTSRSTTPIRVSSSPMAYRLATWMEATISFATSRPAEQLFPLEEIRTTCREVLGGAQAAAILQLGSPSGYPPLREYLLSEARRAGIAHSQDDILITNGCQQGLDLLQRVLVRGGDTVLVAVVLSWKGYFADLTVTAGILGSAAPALLVAIPGPVGMILAAILAGAATGMGALVGMNSAGPRKLGDK